MDIVKLKDNEILSGINELVDKLYNDNINEYIKDRNNTDKRVIFMFIMMYFYTYIFSKEELTKNDIKVIISDLIKNKDKRLECLGIYKNVENMIQYSTQLKLK